MITGKMKSFNISSNPLTQPPKNPWNLVILRTSFKANHIFKKSILNFSLQVWWSILFDSVLFCSVLFCFVCFFFVQVDWCFNWLVYFVDGCVAGTTTKEFENGPAGWCTYTTKNTELKCYHSDKVAEYKVAKKTNAASQELLQPLALTSSAASTNNGVVKALRQRKFPTFDHTTVPDDFNFLVDAGHFNNLPFAPFSQVDKKILVFEYTDNKSPISNFRAFQKW